MARFKHDKPKFWCPECRLVGYRLLELVQERAKQHNKVIWDCPHRPGFHFGPRAPQ